MDRLESYDEKISRIRSEKKDEVKVDAAPLKPVKPARVRAKWCFLTYSQCPYSPREILDAIASDGMADMDAAQWMGVQEQHRDGQPHSHILVKWADKPDLPMDGLDFVGDNGEQYHCNIQTAGQKSEKNKQLKWRRAKIAYVHKKAGKYPDGNFNAWDTDDWRDYLANKRDCMAWIADRCVKESPFPFRIIYWKDMVFAPGMTEKKSNWLIVTEPGFGKTPWLENTFENKAVFRRRPDNMRPYEQYNGEQVIICDDCTPDNPEEIIWMTEYRKIETPVWGFTRYNTTFMKLKQRNIFIICCNLERLPKWTEDPAMRARFNVRMLNDRVREASKESKEEKRLRPADVVDAPSAPAAPLWGNSVQEGCACTRFVARGVYQARVHEKHCVYRIEIDKVHV